MFDKSTENLPKATPIFRGSYVDSAKIWKGLANLDSVENLFKGYPQKPKP
jgi:hypothetical protein